MGLQWAENTIEIAASPDEVFDAITDYETFPEWQSAVIGTEVTERERRSKLGEIVKFEVDGKVRKVRYSLRYRYDRPEKITWDFLEGEGINQMDGGYTLKETGTGTSATYKVGIDVTGVPGPLLKRAHRSTVKRANEDLKAEAERRAGASAPTDEHPAASSGDDDESITDAAIEVGESVVKLGSVAASRTLGVLGGIGRRLRG